jgi:hypothetical protein
MKFIKIFKYLAPTSQITHQLSIMNTNQSNSFSEIIMVYCIHHMGGKKKKKKKKKKQSFMWQKCNLFLMLCKW